MRVMFLGDVHGNISWMIHHVIPECKRRGVDLILQLGDFGFVWPGNNAYDALNEFLVKENLPMWFVDGNHDDHDKLTALALHLNEDDEPGVELVSHIRYLPRGTRFTLDGVSFLALGGAYSIDKDWRTPHVSWWPQEEITDAQARRAIEGGKAVVMLTHDMPWGVKLAWDRKADFPRAAPNRQLLQWVVEEVRPKWLFHGHLHYRQTSLMPLPGGHMVRVEALNCDEPYGSNGARIPDENSWMIKDTKDLMSITKDLDMSRVVRVE